MSVDQTEFTTALLDPKQDVPEGLQDFAGRPAGKRFAVYRNNVAVSLTEALITAFPVIHKLLGDDNFRLMAGVFLRQHPPQTPLMMHYGAEMPDFVATFEPVQKYGYLSDIARLELAMRRAYHAADAAPIAPSALQTIPPDRLMTATMSLAPAVMLLRSDWPIHSIWAFNMAGGAKPEMKAEDVLITRPEYDPQILPLPPCGAAFIEAISAGKTFGAALESASACNPKFDLSGALGALLSGGAITEILEGNRT